MTRMTDRDLAMILAALCMILNELVRESGLGREAIVEMRARLQDRCRELLLPES